MMTKENLEKILEDMSNVIDSREAYGFPKDDKVVRDWILKTLLPEIFKNILDHELISLEAGNEKHENWLKGANWMRGQIKQNIKELGVEI